jgi:hypothetical protein
MMGAPIKASQSLILGWQPAPTAALTPKGFFGVVAPAATNKRGFSPSTRSGVGGHRQTGRAPAMACHVRDLDWQTTPRGAIEPQRLFRALANLGGHTKTYGRRRSNTLVSEPRWLADAERGFLWPQRNR